jgi:hypothetical protein
LREREREYIIYKERERNMEIIRRGNMARKGGIQHAKKVFPRERRLLRVKTEKACQIPPNRAKFPPAKNERDI